MIILVTGNIYRGKRLDALTELKERGIRSILNLEDDIDAVETDRLRAKDAGIKFISLPMSEIKRPNVKDLYYAVTILQDKKVCPVYVHCKHGHDRTGYVIAAYRMIVEKWTFEKAYKEAKNMGHSWWFWPYLFSWPKSLHELEKK